MNVPVFDIQQAAELLKRGGVVAFPTETVYGLGASVFHPQAIERIFIVKGRPQDNPLIVHIASLNQLTQIVETPPAAFYLLAQAFFPGPLTVLLPKLPCVPDSVSAGLPRIGVRMPNHPIARQLIEAVGVPLVAPSANLSGKPSSTSAQHVRNDFGNAIDGILDGGACELGIESTVITLDPRPTILRPGSVSQKQLEEVLGCSVPIATGNVEKPLSPGMKYRHYAPQAKVLVFYSQRAMAEYLEKMPHKRRLVVDTIQPEELYARLRQADDEGQEEIVFYCGPAAQQNAALMNRLARASQ